MSGANGAGKSTLLRAIFGLGTVREGDITLRGQSLRGKKANQLVDMGVGFVPQTENVFPTLTVEENMQMGLFLRPKKFSERWDYVVDLFPRLSDPRQQGAGPRSEERRVRKGCGSTYYYE